MPFEGPNDAGLPASVKKLPVQKRRQFVAVFNSVFNKCRQGGGAVQFCEGRAFPQAHGAVKEMTMEPETKDEEATTENKKDGEKCGEVMMQLAPQPLGGAQSYSAADSYHEAQVAEGFIFDQASTFRLIFSNIMEEPGLSLEDKALAVGRASKELAARVRKGPEGERSLLGKVADFLSPGDKAVWTAAFINNLPDSSFAYVEPGGKKDDQGKTVPRSKRHFPFKNVAGNVDLPHLRNALARAPQSPFGDKAMPKLKAAAKVAGIGEFAKKEQVALGQRGTFRAFKDLEGVWRWISVTTNKYKDREEETFSDASHKDYIAFVDREKAQPQLWLWHVPGSRIGLADFTDYADGFVVHSGTFDDDEVAQGFAEGGCEGLAVSHGFKYHEGDEEDGVYDWYRTFEVSVLPATKAANVWTQFQIENSSKEGKMGLSDEKRAFLVGRIGEEATKGIEDNLGSMAKTLEEHGIEFKELVEATEAKTEEKPEDKQSEAPSVENRLTALEAATVKGIKEAMDGFKETLVSDLGKLVDNKIVAALSPQRPAPAVNEERPSQSKGTEVSAEEQERLNKEAKEAEEENSSVHPYVQDLMRAGRGSLPQGSQ